MTVLYALVRDIQDPATSRSTKRQLSFLIRMTDLFLAGSAGYSARQVELFDDVFKVLVETLELTIRTRLARRLATDPEAPAALMRAFAADEAPEVAAPVLHHFGAFADADLIGAAGAGGQDHLFAIAQRKAVSEAVTDLLIERGEQRVVRAVAANAGARISDDGFGRLVLRSGDDAELALLVGVRREIPRHHLVRLLETASAAVCREIIARNTSHASAVKEVVTGVVDDINATLRKQSREHARARKRARRLNEWKELEEGHVHAAARADDFERTVATLSLLADCPVDIVERALLNDDPIAVEILAKAAGCSWATAKVLLQMRAADRKLTQAALNRSRENFEQIERHTARQIIETYQMRRGGPGEAA